MTKLSKAKRKELKERVMEDVRANLYNYQDFVLDCVKKVVHSMSDDDLLRWVGEG